MGATSTNPFLRGNLAPVTEEITAFDLDVTGVIPDDLDGRYVRNGPNPRNPDPAKYHWFTGSGMVHGISIRDGKAEWYRNRWVRDANLARDLGEPAPPSDWPADHTSFAANTNVIQHAGQTLAIVEAGSPPVQLSNDLETMRISNLGGSLPHAFSAHPKRDPLTGELHVVAYWWGWGNQVQYLVVDTDGRVRRTVDIALPGGPMIHDTSITKSYVMIFDLPCVFNLEAAMSGTSLPYQWDTSYEARIGLLPRDGSSDDVVWIPIEPCYIFHPMNSYELDDGKVVLDAVRHRKMFDTERRGPSEGPPTLERWILDPVHRTARQETISDRPQEFPRINETLIGVHNTFGYTAGIENVFTQQSLLKINLDTHTCEARSDSSQFGYGEPVFVPRAGSREEDDGYVIALRQNLATELSELAIFDAQAFTDDPVAVVHLPARVPNGFHGNWMPAAR